MNIIICGLQFGDESKGSVTDYFCRKLDPKCVIRYCGGFQAGHFNQLPKESPYNGVSHIFSQFGSGTFAGISTYYGPNCIFELFAWIVENDKLVEKKAVPDFVLDKHCLVTTVYHRILNQIKSFYDKFGSCGVGIGETRRYWLDYGNDSIFAYDLLDTSNLLEKLRLMKARISEEVTRWSYCTDIFTKRLIKELDDFTPEFLFNQYKKALKEHLGHDLWISSFNKEFDGDYNYDDLVFEGSQGVLLDENYGWKPPHVTWSTTTPKHAFDFMEEYDLNRKKNIVVGVIKSYMTRHGQGPFPSEQDIGVKNEGGTIPTQFNGGMRYGLLDLPLLSYAVSVAKPDCLFVNCMDEFPGMIFEGKPIKCSKEELLHRLNEICPVKYVGYGPTFMDKKEI